MGEEGSTRSKDFSNRGVFGLRSEDSKKRFDSMESLLVSHALFRRGGFLVGRERERVIWFGSGYLSDCAELVILLVEN